MAINNVCKICLKNSGTCHCTGLVSAYSGATTPADISDYSRITNPPTVGQKNILPGHYSGFISEKLAIESKFMGLIKLGLDSDTSIDWTDELRTSPIKEMYPEAYIFLKNMRPAYSDSELLLIAKLMYTTAGLIESLTLLSRFYDITVDPNVTTDPVTGKTQFTISEGSDCIIDNVLFQDYFKVMVRDLLLYKDPTILFASIVFQLDVVNVIKQTAVNINYNAIKKWYTADAFISAQY